jgi:cytoskeletal protein CcmA (bactofilin family)
MAFWNKQPEGGPPAPTGTSAQSAPDPTTTTPKREEPKPMAMLKREDMPTNIPGNSDLNALLGRGSEFEGKLTFEGTVRIDGKFSGSIMTNDVLVVGEGAKVSAEISCGTVIVHGEVVGNIRAKTAIELHHPARVRGNLETPSLMIEKGVVFEGQAKMENIEKAPEKKPASTSTTPAIAAVKA